MRFFYLAGLLALPLATFAAPLVGGDFLVTDVAKRQVNEVTPMGNWVQSFSVPFASWQDNSRGTEQIQGVAATTTGLLAVYDGVFTGGISVLNSNTGIWNQYQVPGLTASGNGKLAVMGDYAFAVDDYTVVTQVSGIVRMNLTDGSWVRFGTNSSLPQDQPIDLTLGPDGLLYALDGDGSPGGSGFDVFDPNTLNLVRHVDFPSDFAQGPGMASRMLRVDRSGNILLNELYGPLYKFSPSMNLLGTYQYSTSPGPFVDDMNLAADGSVMITEFDGTVVTLDANLQQVGSFKTPGVSSYCDSYGGIVPVPEPAPPALFIGMLGSACGLRRMRKHVS